jgi:hypothetical protein
MEQIVNNLIGQILNESVRVCIGRALSDFRKSIEVKLRDMITKLKEEQAK